MKSFLGFALRDRICALGWLTVAAACAAVGFANGPARGATFLTPGGWSVGDSGSTYQEWTAGGNTTTGAIHNNLQVGAANPAGTPVLSVSSPGFIAGSGGYYSFGGNYGFTAGVANHGAPSSGFGTHVIVQTAATLNPDLSSLGFDPIAFEEDFGRAVTYIPDLHGGSVFHDSLRLVDGNGDAIAGGDYASRVQIARTYYEPDFPLFGGSLYEHLIFEFFLPDYVGDFAVKGDLIVHSSLQGVRVDSMIAEAAFAPTAIPEPASLGAIGMAAVGLLGLSRARARRAC